MRLLALWDGKTIPPTHLERAIATLEPLRPDTWIGVFRDAVVADFGDAPRLLDTLPTLSSDALAHLARRLGWTINASSLGLASGSRRGQAAHRSGAGLGICMGWSRRVLGSSGSSI